MKKEILKIALIRASIVQLLAPVTHHDNDGMRSERKTCRWKSGARIPEEPGERERERLRYREAGTQISAWTIKKKLSFSGQDASRDKGK